jgi:hypothetical protein
VYFLGPSVSKKNCCGKDGNSRKWANEWGIQNKTGLMVWNNGSQRYLFASNIRAAYKLETTQVQKWAHQCANNHSNNYKQEQKKIEIYR